VTHWRGAWAVVLLVGFLRHYGWSWFDPAIRGDVSKALGGAALLAVVPFLWRACPTRMMLLALAWWSYEALLIVICATAYVFAPWPLEVGEPMCSGKLGFNLGALGLVIIALVLCQAVRLDRSADREPKR
jgi:hypothetical protein